MNNLLKLLSESKLATAFWQNRPLANLSVNQEALTITGAFLARSQDLVVVKEDLYSAQILYQTMVSFLGDAKVLLFAAEESLRVEAIANSPELKLQRIDTLADTSIQ